MALAIPSEAERILEAAEARARRFMACREVPHPPAKRNHSKRHSENRERSHRDAMKARKGQRALTEHNARQQAVREAVRAYYAGEVPDLSAIAHLL